MSHRWSRIELGNVESRRFDEHGESALDLRPGLQARVADPLWLLARQRQVGEFKGEDAASPVEVRVAGQHVRLTHWGVGGADRPLGAAPLETLVERTPVRDGPGRFGLAIELASLLQRRLHDAGIPVDARAVFPLAAPDGSVDTSRRAWCALMARRSFDAVGLYDAIVRDGEAAVAAVLSSDPRLSGELRSWADAVSGFAEEPHDPEPWLPQRLEHRFDVAARAPGVEVQLTCPEYPGGRLDWWAFDLASVRIGPLAALDRFEFALLPTPLTYAGMPASRWWEMEDGRVHFGDLDAGPEDLARLIVAEFATVGADDWYVIPVPIEHGRLARITGLSVSDTFGRTHEIPAASYVDRAIADRPWRFFELGNSIDAASWMLLAPALASIEEGPVLEAVGLWRDEDANLVWAEERIVEGADGRPFDRAAQWRSRPRRVGTAPAEAGSWSYRLETEVPPHWIPFVPSDPAVAPGELRRGRMSAWERSESGSSPGVRGEILKGAPPRSLEDQEVPIEGVRITRRWQACRDQDGRLHMWIGRMKQSGHLAKPSGLSFDQITGPEGE